MAIKVRVATEGKTVDGREITAEQINQMAASYDPKLYGARIWLEHLRSLFHDSAFQAYGDVLSVSADTVDGKRTLFAELDPTPELIAINQKRQKVFTSIEMHTNFQGTGEAYLVGLAVTDTPASTGTDILKFSIEKNSPQIKEALFSEYTETEFPAIDDKTESDDGLSLKEKMKSIFSRSDKKFNQAEDAILHLTQTLADRTDDVKSLSETVEKQQKTIETLTSDLATYKKDFEEFKQAIDGDEPVNAPRPENTGADKFSTDC